MIIRYNGKTPVIGRNVFVAPTAVVIGDVEIKDNASIWYGVVVRGDMEPILIGENTNIQDNCTVHTDQGHPVLIGENVSVGHNAVIHGCTIEKNSLVAMNAVVLNGSVIGRYSVVAAGSVIKEFQKVAPYHLMAGVPATVKKKLTEAEIESFQKPVEDYRVLSKIHRNLTENL